MQTHTVPRATAESNRIEFQDRSSSVMVQLKSSMSAKLSAPVLKSGWVVRNVSYVPIILCANPRVFTDSFSRNASARLRATLSSTSKEELGGKGKRMASNRCLSRENWDVWVEASETKYKVVIRRCTLKSNPRKVVIQQLQ